MSQIQSFGDGGGSEDAVLSLTGDDGLAVEATLNNINVLGESIATAGFAQVAGDLGTSTLLILPLSGSATTTDGLFTEVYSITLPNNSSAVLTASVAGTRADYSLVCGGIITGVGSKMGAAAVSLRTTGLITTNYNAGGTPPSVTMIGTATTMSIRVRGEAGQTWNWTAQITYQFAV